MQWVQILASHFSKPYALSANVHKHISESVNGILFGAKWSVFT